MRKRSRFFLSNRSWFIIAFVLCRFHSTAHDVDSLVTIRHYPLFKSMLARPNFESTVYVRHLYLKSSFQRRLFVDKDLFLIKNARGVFLLIVGTSRVYELYDQNDSLLYFRRNDIVENINYNLSAYYFSHRDTLYNYAGYGFWKSNGLLRKYNVISREWDIVPVNKEVHHMFDVPHAWKNPRTGKIYLFFEQVLNEGVDQEEKMNQRFLNTHVLDVSKANIQKLGTLSANLFELIINANKLIHTNEGMIVVNAPYAYYIKPEENTYYTITDKSMTQSIQRTHRNGIYYCYDDKIFFSNTDYQVMDSIPIKNLSVVKAGVIWSKTDRVILIRVLLGLIIMPTFLLFLLHYLKRRKNSRRKIKPNMAKMIAVPILTETEASLLQMLINKTLEGGFASSNEINYIIGCKDKNVGLQKKMRSDMINGINTKFKAYSKNELPLIDSQRTDADKRYFQYAIHPECLDQAQEFVEMTRSLDS